MNKDETINFMNKVWNDSVIPAMCDYIRIPNKSPGFDKKWEEHGYMDKVAKLLADWCQKQNIHGMELEILRFPGHTPLIFIEIPGEVEKTVLFYGHFDKQPEMEGWDADLGPWKPVVKDEKLYGRGAGDDGYAIFSALTSIKALQEQNIPYPRCLIMIEGCEESGSIGLPDYIEHLQDRIKIPDLIICLDSGCFNYEQLWITTSLRGLVSGTLSVKVLEEGIHSGIGSGVIASSFRILRQLLSRVEDENTGKILLDALHVSIPESSLVDAQNASKIIGDAFYDEFPVCKGVQAVSEDISELILNRTWRPALSITGIDNIPSIENAGNVLRSKTNLKLSFRIPPTCNEAHAAEALKKILEKDPPYNAHVTFTPDEFAKGWDAPKISDKLRSVFNESSQQFFGKPAQFYGEGGSIPLMALLADKFPSSQFLVTGVLGPLANAHGPNEFLHIPMVKKLTCCVASIVSYLMD